MDVQSVTRAFAVLEALNERPVGKVETLHRATGLPKSTVVRMLETLSNAGYVEKISRRDGYALTERVLRLSSGLAFNDVIIAAARPLLEDFTRRHKWQVSIATPENGGMRVRFNTRHISPFAVSRISINQWIKMLESALGRGYIAYCSPMELKLYRRGEGLNGSRGLPIEKFDILIGRIRERRYATIPRPAANPTRSFAIPVLLGGDQPYAVASLAMFYFDGAMTEEEATRKYLNELYQISNAIGERLEGEDA